MLYVLNYLMLKQDKNAEVCDATGDALCIAAGYIHKI